VASGLADQASTDDEQLKRSTVIEWVENSGSSPPMGSRSDGRLTGYTRTSPAGGQRKTFISDFYRTGQPFTRAQVETVSVDVQSVLQDMKKRLKSNG
jgi:type IV secretory pathway TrbF-like protein